MSPACDPFPQGLVRCKLENRSSKVVVAETSPKMSSLLYTVNQARAFTLISVGKGSVLVPFPKNDGGHLLHGVGPLPNGVGHLHKLAAVLVAISYANSFINLVSIKITTRLL
jgi:hypothetical protein